ncbi:MAG: hypothetical protein COU51_01425 [Parcubacteria group bacterium CG10_big_fil_rev_8_21_14_0_10_36_14]|nr:MAG: hypothetical protein COU51_01425 [Parcubacteria group bacterium CG10_big_fil_rev_8_21_14_0_10_36_14]
MLAFNDLKNLFESYVVNGFYKLKGLAASLFIVFCLLLSVHVLIRNDFNYEWYLYGIIFFVIIVFWVVFKYFWPYKKNKDRKTGLVVAISSENYEGVKMKNKFITELKRQINDTGLDKYFEIIPLLNHHSEKIKNKEDIITANEKIDGHIFFYGDVQKEYDGKKIKKYFLNIDGYVAHLPIPIQMSQELAFDFRAMLPKEINFSEFFELRGCKATAKIVYLTTKYVVGVASFLSGNPFLAFKMHKNLADELSEYKTINKDKNLKELTKFDLKKLKSIKNKIPLIISNEALIIATIYYANNTKTKAIEFLSVSLEKNKINYRSWVLKAIFDFIFDNNPEKAFESIKKAKKYSKDRFEWRYSWAFLEFWNKNYEEAYKMCQKIEKQSYINEEITLNEVEDFNLKILKSKNVPQLYFWIGYLNYKKKLDFQNALKYFEEFLKRADEKTMNFLIIKTNSFLIDIKKQIDF